MKDNNRNAPGQAMWYTTPQVKVVDVKARDILCMSNPPITETDPEEDILP